jgi:hypothetical protein
MTIMYVEEKFGLTDEKFLDESGMLRYSCSLGLLCQWLGVEV